MSLMVALKLCSYGDTHSWVDVISGCFRMLQIPSIVTIAKHYVLDQQHHHRWQWTADCLITTFNSPFIVIHPSRWSLQFHTNLIIILPSDQERDRSFQQTPPVVYQVVCTTCLIYSTTRQSRPGQQTAVDDELSWLAAQRWTEGSGT